VFDEVGPAALPGIKLIAVRNRPARPVDRCLYSMQREIMNVLKAMGVLFATFVYVVFPFDVIPDLIPILGQIDDLTVITWGCKAAYKLLKSQDEPAATA
jgi:uncharacterized membrane protein YkvA (DUF1232 family)